jgi:spore germination protein YaaH
MLTSTAHATETVFYVLRYQTSDRMTPPSYTVASLKKNYKKISILIPQAYSIDVDGNISKGIEPEILAFATAHHMKIMPLVTNSKFDKQIVHEFLGSQNAQRNAINQLTTLCSNNHFYGMQLDFEMVPLFDRDIFTRFYQNAAAALHKSGCKVSFAVAPVVTEQPVSLFYKKIYENWEGAYDLKALGQSGDFISIMAYNQHGGVTTPGTTASLPWVEQTVKYALQFVPANKISIGIADYSTHWYTGQTKKDGEDKVAVRMRAINYETAAELINTHHAAVVWNEQTSIPYALFENNWLTEYVFVENNRSFKKKLGLVKQYQLRGVSVFDLGTEDPAIWQQL